VYCDLPAHRFWKFETLTGCLHREFWFIVIKISEKVIASCCAIGIPYVKNGIGVLSWPFNLPDDSTSQPTRQQSIHSCFASQRSTPLTISLSAICRTVIVWVRKTYFLGGGPEWLFVWMCVPCPVRSNRIAKRNKVIESYYNGISGSSTHKDQKSSPVTIVFSEDSTRKRITSNRFHEWLLRTIEWLRIQEFYEGNFYWLKIGTGNAVMNIRAPWNAGNDVTAENRLASQEAPCFTE
jgi:hypothetical protein